MLSKNPYLTAVSNEAHTHQLTQPNIRLVWGDQNKPYPIHNTRFATRKVAQLSYNVFCNMYLSLL